MKLLMLGGTEFVGHAITEEALARGWEMTVFHRGRHQPPPGVRTLLGDRCQDGGLAALERGEWDVVVDTWSGAPSVVRASARLLAGRAGRHVYISSRSVYCDPRPAGQNEAAPVVDAAPDLGEVEYAQAKRGGELAAEESFGERALLVRAGLVLGPRENIGRLPWWLLRIARGGKVMAPGPEDSPIRFIDVRDLATWTLDAAVRGLGGPYDLVCPPGHGTMGELLRACAEVTGSDAELCWTEPEAVLAAGARPWIDLPVWLPPGELHDAIHGGSVDKALAAGLRCRPMRETVAGTWQWLRELDGPPPQRPDRPVVGLQPDLEARILRGE
ncbi:NAD-dependent epimerase/dehydratase family protein [Streptomyces orinoci]|uniref:NAD-dependent epimerase/dehydratase family protein n=1 Tax=Streptomyces orinoci TaxID=67339 RepID=A0ABV3JWD2_STRON|nr:NAD-dependent epimerase/dehydratase family protein [Streptomyces orinoci]